MVCELNLYLFPFIFRLLPVAPAFKSVFGRPLRFGDCKLSAATFRPRPGGALLFPEGLLVLATGGPILADQLCRSSLKAAEAPQPARIAMASESRP